MSQPDQCGRNCWFIWKLYFSLHSSTESKFDSSSSILKTKHYFLQSWILNEFGCKSVSSVLYPVEKEAINLRTIHKIILQFPSLRKKSQSNTNHPGNKLS